jgi:trehalose synthase-fused probable maltokinase
MGGPGLGKDFDEDSGNSFGGPVANDSLDRLKVALKSQLPAYLLQQRWFGGKAREFHSTEVFDTVPMRRDGFAALVIFARVEYADGGRDLYAIPLIAGSSSPTTPDNDRSLHIPSEKEGHQIVLRDALQDERFLSLLLEAVQTGLIFPGPASEIRTSRTKALASYESIPVSEMRPRPIKAEQSNTSVIYGDRFIMKFYRRLEEGINPDLEIGTFLTERAQFAHIPQLLGSLEYLSSEARRMTQGILQTYVPNQGDAWQYTLKSISSFYEEVAKHPPETPPHRSLPDFARASLAPYLDSAALLAKRTAELHLALASDAHDSAFAPEPFDERFQRAFEKSLLELTQRVFALLRQTKQQLPDESRAKAEEIEKKESEIIARFQSSLHQPIRATRIRIHGDYHLGQVLYTGSDFVIIDFEGEPARPLSERRTKRSPLQDVAGMLRSFHYAAHVALLAPANGISIDKNEIDSLKIWAESWSDWVTDKFLTTYLHTAGGAHYLPPTAAEIKSLLQVHLLEKAVYELSYELNNRPTWVEIPLEGISKALTATTPVF